MCGREALAVALVAWGLGCGRPAGTSTPRPGPSADGPAPSAGAEASALRAPQASSSGSEGEGGAPGWPALVRDEQWDAAAHALEALSDADKQRPEVRYARARVALERGEASMALALLQGLEMEMPLLADDVARRRAEAMRVAGPFEEAGAWFAARAAPSAQLEAARAFEKANDVRRARVAAERLLGTEKRTHAQEAEARALRVRL
ncbi:MAG: hypothetical protein M3O36_02885, partial [Myxococcota bacterium]|nr:hypothetical protein [Myxococcota bacterium]